MIEALENERKKRPRKTEELLLPSPNQKLLAAILDSAFVRIPGNPNDSHFRQSQTLGPSATHWFRDKFFKGRFRLFFRFQSQAKVIVLAWVNDSETLRTYGSSSDAYAVFTRMLQAGNPPNDWNELLAQSSGPANRGRGRKLLPKRK